MPLLWAGAVKSAGRKQDALHAGTFRGMRLMVVLSVFRPVNQDGTAVALAQSNQIVDLARQR